MLDDRSATFLDWSDPDRPHRVGAIELTDPVGVAAAGSNVIIVAASEAVMVDADASTKPTITARGEIDGSELFACSHNALVIARADTVMLHTVDDGRIRPTRELQVPVPAEHLAFSDRRLVVAGGSEVLLLSDNGDVHATWTAAHRIEGLVASGRSIWIRAGGIDTRLDATGDRLAPVSTVTTVDPALTFSPGPHPGTLLRRSNDNQLELWAITRHQLRRDPFKQAFTMRNPLTRAAH